MGHLEKPDLPTNASLGGASPSTFCEFIKGDFASGLRGRG